MTNVVQRLRELSIQSANGIYTSDDRSYIQVEVSQLVDEIDRIASQAHFNTQYMLTGRFAATDKSGSTNNATSMWIHMGANMDERARLYVKTMTANALGLRQGGAARSVVSLSTLDNANRAIGTFDVALKRLNTQRADIGAYQNRMELAVQQLSVAAENFQASESRIRDTDFAKETTILSTKTILLQSATSMLAQANVQPQLALKLLQ